MTIKELLYMGADTLCKAGISDCRLDAWYLLSYYMNIGKNEYYKNPDRTVTAAEINGYNALIAERSERKPLQYITGEQEFMGLTFKVDNNVLIPRQDTEILTELVIKHASGKKVLDMCTGSGCIAISVAKYSEALSVTASDISKKALDVAIKNAEYNNTDVVFVLSDMWDNICGQYDILVSNPPYITCNEMKSLMPEVSVYEPHIALDGGIDGLDYYRKILAGAEGRITKDGAVFFEIGCTQAEQVSRLLQKYGFNDIRVEKDLAGLDRVVWGHF